MAIDSCLVDTNILLRMIRSSDPDFPVIDVALNRLLNAGTKLYFTHQNMTEFWNVITRPQSSNGYGLPPEEAAREVRSIQRTLS